MVHTLPNLHQSSMPEAVYDYDVIVSFLGATMSMTNSYFDIQLHYSRCSATLLASVQISWGGFGSNASKATGSRFLRPNASYNKINKVNAVKSKIVDRFGSGTDASKNAQLQGRF